jgi:hypothetical protein
VTRWAYLPENLPIEDLPLDVPLDWSPEQALAAYEWLERLRDHVWLLYGDDIQELLRDNSLPTAQPPTNDDSSF